MRISDWSSDVCSSDLTDRPAGATAKSLASAGRSVATVAILGRVGLQTRNSDPRTTTMTEDKIALRALLEKGSDATFLRELIGFAAQRLMELERSDEHTSELQSLMRKSYAVFCLNKTKPSIKI